MSNILRILAFSILNLCWALELKPCNEAPYEQLCKLSENYNKDKVPGSWPLILIPEFDIWNIAEVNTNDGSITIFVELNVNWEDQNIVYKYNQRLVINKCSKSSTLCEFCVRIN